MTYVYAFNHPHGLPLSEVTSLVGGKAANLGVMTNDLESAGATRFCHLNGSLPSIPRQRMAVRSGRGDRTNNIKQARDGQSARGFGERRNPLLVSVRSGAPISMPGMMDTILNLGLNPDTARGLVTLTATRIRGRVLEPLRQPI